MSNFVKKYNKLAELPDLSFKGYIWFSNEDRPMEVTIKADIQLQGNNPFIVEGFLLSEDETKSITLSSQNGKLVIYEFDLVAIRRADKSTLTYDSFLVHRLENYTKIHFITVWQPEKDPNCENMEVLKPTMRVFNGFE